MNKEKEVLQGKEICIESGRCADRLVISSLPHTSSLLTNLFDHS